MKFALYIVSLIVLCLVSVGCVHKHKSNQIPTSWPSGVQHPSPMYDLNRGIMYDAIPQTENYLLASKWISGMARVAGIRTLNNLK